MKNPAILLGLLGLWLTACQIPMQKSSSYENGYLKERYSAYEKNGQEVKDGLYLKWFPNGEKELEVFYRDGVEISKTFYSSNGSVMGTITLAHNNTDASLDDK